MLTRKTGMLVLAASCLLALAGCGASSSHHAVSTAASKSPTTAPSRSSAALESSESSCTSALTNSNVRVTIYGEGGPACTAWDRSASATAVGSWQVVAFSPNGSTAQVICSVTRHSTLIEVRDTGNPAAAHRICAALTRSQDSEAGVRADVQAKRKAESERPGHVSAAARLSGEAASLQKRAQHEEALASADEAHAEHLLSRADKVEAEESGEGGNKEAEARKVRAAAQGPRGQAQAHQANATKYKHEAEAKEAEAESERAAAAPAPSTWVPQ